MYKAAQANIFENEKVKDEIDAFAIPEIVKLYDMAVNNPGSPEGDISVTVLTNSKIPAPGAKPVITINVQGNTPEVTKWAIDYFKKIQRQFVAKVSQIAQKASAPFDADTKVQRTY